MGVESLTFSLQHVRKTVRGVAFLSYRIVCDLTLLRIINKTGKLIMIYLYFFRFPTTMSFLGGGVVEFVVDFGG